MKKALALLLALGMVAGILTGCGGSKKDGTVYQIGISQYVEHAALDASYQGFVDALAEAGYVDGENIVLDYQNAQGDQSNTNTIASKFVNDGKDLIYAIATPSAQAVANATEDIPILIAAVTDPVSTGLAESADAPGHNVTGTSDLTPVKEQMDLLVRLLPDAKTVGILYDSGEDNSHIQAAMAVEAAEALGLTAIEYTVSGTSDVQSVVTSMVGKVDVIYSPTDNTIASAMATVAMIANENKIPTIVGEEGMVGEGGMASYSISYYELGRITGQMAVEILEGKSEPAKMPIRYQTGDLEFVYNEDTATLLGIEIPEDLIND